MKKNLLKYLAIILFGCLTLSFIISWIYGDKIKTQVLKQVNESVEADVQIENVSVNLFKQFPNLQVQLEGIQIIGKNEFKNDTLAKIEQVNLSVSLLAYFKNNTIQVNGLSIEKANLLLKVLANGKANWDITKPSTEQPVAKEQASPIALALKSYEIEESEITYQDLSRQVFTHIKGLNHTGKGNFAEELFTLETSTQIEKWDMRFLGNPVLSQVKASLEAPISMNFKTQTFEFKNNTLMLNELPISFSYKMAMPDSSIDMDLNFSSNQAPIKNFLSLIPALYSNKFNDLEASGKAELKGMVKGKLTDTEIPHFDIQLNIANGAFAYKGRPEKVHQANIGLQVNNETGQVAQTTLHFSPLNFKINEDAVVSNVHISNPTGDPQLNGAIQGTIHLENLAKLFPKEGVSYAGLLKSNVSFKGKLSELKAGKGAVNGTASIKQFKGVYQNNTLDIPLIEGEFTPQVLQVKSQFQYLDAPFDVKGGIKNIFGFFMKGESLSSNLDIKIQSIDIQKAFKNIELVQKYLPIAGNLAGSVSPQFAFEGVFDQAFNLQLPTVQAEGRMLTSEINGTGSPIIKQIMQVAKWKGAQDFRLQPADLNFKVSDGRLIFKPFDLQTNLGKLAVSGSNGLDKSLDYSIKTTLEAQKIDQGLGQKLNQELQKVSQRLSVGQILSKIPVEVKITGTVDKPMVKLGVSGAGNGKTNEEVIKETVKEVVKTEMKAQKNKALEEAQKRADAEMERARAMAEDLKAKAYAEADKLVEQAANPIAKFAAKKVADRLKKEADKKVEKILEDAQKKANEQIEKAKSLE